MKRITKLGIFLIFIVFICGGQTAKNIPGKKKIFNQLNELQYKKIPKAEYKIMRCAKNNKDYKKAVQIIHNIRELLDNAWDFYNSDQLEQANALIKEIDDKLKKAVKTAKSKEKNKNLKRKYQTNFLAMPEIL